MRERPTRLTSQLQDGQITAPMAAAAASVDEQTTAPIPVSGHNAPRAASSVRQVRPGRETSGGPGRDLAPLPPLRPAPARLAPVLLFISQSVVDMAMIGSAFVIAYILRFQTDIFRIFAQPDPSTYATMLVVTVATIIVTFYFSKLYSFRRGASRVDEFYRIAGAVSMGTVLSLATNSLILGDRFVYSRQILLMGWVLAIVYVTVGRLIFGFVLGQLRKRGFDRARVLVIGTGPTAAMVISRLRWHKTLGFEIVGAVESNGGQQVPVLPQVPLLGDLSNLTGLIHTHKIDEVIVALSAASDRELREIIGLLQDETVSIRVYPDAFQLMTDNELSVGELSGLPLLSVKDVALRGWNRILKRAFDLVFCSIMLIVTAPLMLAIAIGIKLGSPGPVFFIQERVGLDNVPFQMVKFRTMRVENDPALIGKVSQGEPGWTVANDPRRTRLGSFLRRFSLDELPQFFNVLVGEMSVVGPRPEQVYYVQEFAQRIPKYLRRHREKAGLTGWAQVNGLRGDTSIEERTAADLYYVENWSLLFDLKIIARTVASMFRGKNAY